MSDRVDLREFLGAYVAEVDELIRTLTSRLLSTEEAARRGEARPREVREIFRAMHTVKGLSAMVGIEPIVVLAHRLETHLREADRLGGGLDLRTIEVLLEAVHVIEKAVRAVERGESPSGAGAALEAELDKLEAPAALPPPSAVELPEAIDAKLAPYEKEQLARAGAGGKRAWRADYYPSPEKAASGLNVNVARERVSKIAEIVKVLPVARAGDERAPGGLCFAILLLSDAPGQAIAEAIGGVAADVVPLFVREQVETGAAVAPNAPLAAPLATPLAPTLEPLGSSDRAPGTAFVDALDAGGEHGVSHGLLRVDAARIDDAMDRMAGVIVSRSRLARAVEALAASGAPVRDLVLAMSDHTRKLRDLRGAILRVRMVPVAEVIQRLPLVVRNLQRQTGKRVRLETEGGRAELDKTVAERLFPALLHLVRNAVDHGLESPDERRRAGKPHEGSIRVRCRAESDRFLEIQVEDDGRGIDRASVARAAGLGGDGGDVPLLDLIARPGVSTARTATETSGRGMGMDIVRRIVTTQLGGELAVRTEPGVGTRFSLRVPLTLAVIDAFTFSCGGQRFATPVSAVEEIVDLQAARIVSGPSRSNGPVRLFERRGEAVALVDLARALERNAGLRAEHAEHAAHPLEALQEDSPLHAFVVRHGDEAVALAVGRVFGQHEAVVRPIDDPLVRVPGVSGATDLGDGVATIVLDLPALAALEHAA